MRFDRDEESGLLLPKRRSFLFLGFSAIAGALLPPPPPTPAITLSSPGWTGLTPRSPIIQIDDELIYIIGQTDPFTVIVRRGVNGTLPAPHLINGTAVTSEDVLLPFVH